MARSQLERRQDAERERIAAYTASLNRVSQRARPAPDFHTAIQQAMTGFDHAVVRSPEAWRPQIKTRDPGRLRLAAARHLFGRYPVADHLEQVWLESDGLAPEEIWLRKTWFVVAASGGSLFKNGADAWLSRKEVHAFLNPLGRPGFDEAIWQAIARSYTTDAGLALRIAGSAIARTSRSNLHIWRRAVRFFCAHPVALEEMNDLCDYLADCWRRDPTFSLDGRTPVSLGRRMRAWHDDLAAVARIEGAVRRRAEAERMVALRAQGRVPGQTASPPELPNGGRWPGMAIPGWSWRPSARERRRGEEFIVVQLCSAADLVEETRAMHHCVSSYAGKCIAGQASIWSLRHRADGATSRLLTIEVDSRFRAIQVRGFANRTAHADERKILERWAKARGIDLVGV